MDFAALICNPSHKTADRNIVALSSASLESFWQDLVGDSYASRQGLQVFLDVVKTVDATGNTNAEFNFLPSGWEIRLSRAAAQVILSSALLSGILAILGADQLPAAVLAAVVPLLFDVDTVSMTEGDQYLLARLLDVPGTAGAKMTREQLYARLPKEIREQTTFRDFIEFLDVCRKIGQADVDEDGKVAVRRAKDRKFRITFH